MSPCTDRPIRRSAALTSSAPLFAALGEATRLRLMATLCAGGALSIAQLTAGTAITRQVVTKHLNVLAEAGLVHHLRRGRERLWEFEPLPLVEARQALDAISAEWSRALSRLKRFIEE